MVDGFSIFISSFYGFTLKSQTKNSALKSLQMSTTCFGQDLHLIFKLGIVFQDNYTEILLSKTWLKN